jgi:FixJ family two-component response regulator
MNYEFKVLVVDDDASVLKALSRLLRSAGLTSETFASPVEFLKVYDPAGTACLVLDLTMPGLNGLELQHALLEKGAPPPIIFLTGTAGIPASVQAMKQGAVDFLTKPVDETVLLAAVQSALQRERASRKERLELFAIHCRLQSLTPREREVLAYVVSGRLNKQIAAQLGTAEQTIKVHRARVMEKLQVGSLAELVHLSGRLGIDKVPTP